jgi:hypothetical protein
MHIANRADLSMTASGELEQDRAYRFDDRVISINKIQRRKTMKTLPSYVHLMRPTWARQILALVLFLLALLAPSTPTHASQRTQLADLPPAAQTLVSSTLGHDDATYQFQPTADGYHAANASHTWQADFSNLGMRLTANNSQWTFALQGIGYGDAVQTVSAVAPTANANRLEYAHDALTEWYVNGPVGLEQGWTITSPPSSTPLRSAQNGGAGALTLTLALNGKARLDTTGSSIALLNDDGTVALNYTGLYAYDATGRELRAWMEMGKGGVTPPLQIRVDDTDARYPLTIDPYLLVATLTYAGAVTDESMGISVAISADGSTIIAGACYGGSNFQGMVYVFVKPSGGWATTGTPTAVLTNASGASGNCLGGAVGISADGSTIAAGALGVSSYKGAVYVFVKPSGGWADTGTPTAVLTKASSANDDKLGYSVAISRDNSTIVTGAPGVNSNKGAIYVYVKSGSWVTATAPTKTLAASGASNDQFGISVAISSDGATIVAGAYGVSSYKGAAYVFVRPVGGWATLLISAYALTNASGANNDKLGYSVAISSDGATVVAGAYGVSSNHGAAYVFTKPSGGWATTSSPSATLTNASSAGGDGLGLAVAINPNGTIIFANVQLGSSNKGAVYVFDQPSGGWTTTGTPTTALTNPNGANGDMLGSSIAISTDDSTIVVGAAGVSNGKGAAEVFCLGTRLYLPLITR